MFALALCVGISTSVSAQNNVQKQNNTMQKDNTQTKCANRNTGCSHQCASQCGGQKSGISQEQIFKSIPNYADLCAFMGNKSIMANEADMLRQIKAAADKVKDASKRTSLYKDAYAKSKDLKSLLNNLTKVDATCNARATTR